MAPSSDVNDTDEDESKNYIVHEPFDKPSSENLIMDVVESECNIVNENSSQSDSLDVPTNVISKLNYDDCIEPSANVKETSYFNIFECGRNQLDHLDVMYQRAFTASETSQTVPTASEPSSKAPITGHYISPSRERYWDLQAKILTEKAVRMDKDRISEAISQVRLEDEAYYERIIEYLAHEDDGYSSSWKGDAVGFAAVTDSSDSGEISFKIPVTKIYLGKNPASRKEPIKDTPTLKTPITGSYLGKRLRQSESGPTDMRPFVTEPLTLTENPFKPEPLTEHPVVIELDFIGQGGP